jgi:hypothetical protein
MQNTAEQQLKAYHQAVSELGPNGWTTCQFFIQQRVTELLKAEHEMPKKVLRMDLMTKTEGYEAL